MVDVTVETLNYEINLSFSALTAAAVFYRSSLNDTSSMCKCELKIADMYYTSIKGNGESDDFLLFRERM